MAGKFCEGDRVFTATDDAAASSADINELQDQLKYMMEARRFDVTSLFVPDSTGNWTGSYTIVSGQYYLWQSGANPNGDRMVAWLPLRVGEKLISIDVLYLGSNRTGGEMALYERQHIAVGNAAALNAPSKLFDLGENGTNPWQPTVNPTNFHRVRTTINKIIEDDYQYYVSIQASTTGAGNAEEFYALIVNPQFGNQ